MTDDVDPIIVAGDDGVILDESSESERATLDEFGIVATDGGERVDDQDESDTVVVTDDDGEVLCEIDVPPGAEVSHSADGSITTIERPAESAETTTCEHCGECFDVGETRGTFDGSRARYVCPNCGETTEGPPPGVR